MKICIKKKLKRLKAEEKKRESLSPPPGDFLVLVFSLSPSQFHSLLLHFVPFFLHFIPISFYFIHSLMVSTSVSVSAAVVIVCGGAAVAAAAASSSSSLIDGSDPLSSSVSELAVRIASAAVASSSSLAASSYYVQGKDIGEVARVVGSGELRGRRGKAKEMKG